MPAVSTTDFRKQVPSAGDGVICDVAFRKGCRGQHFSAVVLVKGCALHCPWCLLPEGLVRRIRTVVKPSVCIGRERCGIESCPGKGELASLRGAPSDELPMWKGRTIASACPTGALSPDGKATSVAQVMRKIVGNRDFASRQRRQVVISGGEPMQQHKFVRRILQAAKRRDLRTVLDTSAMTSWRLLETLLPLVDQFWVDLKIIDGERHRQMCGEENFAILENLRRLCHREANVVITFPVIPGYTDTKDNLRDVGDFLKHLKPQPQLRLLPHVMTGHDRSDRLGMAYPLANVPPPPEKRLKQVRAYFRRRRIAVVGPCWGD